MVRARRPPYIRTSGRRVGGSVGIAPLDHRPFLPHKADVGGVVVVIEAAATHRVDTMASQSIGNARRGRHQIPGQSCDAFIAALRRFAGAFRVGAQHDPGPAVRRRRVCPDHLLIQTHHVRRCGIADAVAG